MLYIYIHIYMYGLHSVYMSIHSVHICIDCIHVIYIKHLYATELICNR